MPIYEYECGKCGVFEVSQRISDAALSKCPTCRRKVRRLISNTSFQLKGSGWYVTDYARGGKGAKDGGDGAKGESGGDGKSDAKTDTKSTKSKSGTGAKSDAKAQSAATTTAKAS